MSGDTCKKFELCRVMESLKDYSIKALVNTIDHLGSITSKMENSIDEKLVQVGHTELKFSCIEQVHLELLVCFNIIVHLEIFLYEAIAES